VRQAAATKQKTCRPIGRFVAIVSTFLRTCTAAFACDYSAFATETEG
jgi:hypothetical protein